MIEDEEMVRRMAVIMLERLGMTVFEAKDGVEGVEVFRRNKDTIQCVVCDLTMPGMCGWKTIAALRAVRPGLPVVLASGYDYAKAMDGDHPEQPQAFLGKPYGMAALKDALVQSLVDRAIQV